MKFYCARKESDCCPIMFLLVKDRESNSRLGRVYQARYLGLSTLNIKTVILVHFVNVKKHGVHEYQARYLHL